MRDYTIEEFGVRDSGLEENKKNKQINVDFWNGFISIKSSNNV